MSLKIELVERANAGEPLAALCREFGISRTTGHKWLKRFRELGYEGLEEVSKRPKSTPLATAEDMVVAGVLGLVALRRRLSSARLACSAIPPDAPGGPCGCRVCGADLPARPSSQSAVIPCSYCVTDNLVDEASMRRAGATREYVLSSHEGAFAASAVEILDNCP